MIIEYYSYSTIHKLTYTVVQYSNINSYLQYCTTGTCYANRICSRYELIIQSSYHKCVRFRNTQSSLCYNRPAALICVMYLHTSPCIFVCYHRKIHKAFHEIKKILVCQALPVYCILCPCVPTKVVILSYEYHLVCIECGRKCDCSSVSVSVDISVVVCVCVCVCVTVCV